MISPGIPGKNTTPSPFLPFKLGGKLCKVYIQLFSRGFCPKQLTDTFTHPWSQFHVAFFCKSPEAQTKKTPPKNSVCVSVVVSTVTSIPWSRTRKPPSTTETSQGKKTPSTASTPSPGTRATRDLNLHSQAATTRFQHRHFSLFYSKESKFSNSLPPPDDCTLSSFKAHCAEISLSGCYQWHLEPLVILNCGISRIERSSFLNKHDVYPSHRGEEDLAFLSSSRPEPSGRSTRTPCLADKRMFCDYSVPPAEGRMLALCRPLLRFHAKDNRTFMRALGLPMLPLKVLTNHHRGSVSTLFHAVSVWFPGDVPLAARGASVQHQDGGLDDNSERRSAQLHRRPGHRRLLHHVNNGGLQHLHRHRVRGVSPRAGWVSPSSAFSARLGERVKVSSGKRTIRGWVLVERKKKSMEKQRYWSIFSSKSVWNYSLVWVKIRSAHSNHVVCRPLLTRKRNCTSTLVSKHI